MKIVALITLALFAPASALVPGRALYRVFARGTLGTCSAADPNNFLDGVFSHLKGFTSDRTESSEETAVDDSIGAALEESISSIPVPEPEVQVAIASEVIPLAKDPLSEAIRFGQKVPKGELKKFIKLHGGKLPPKKAKQSSFVDVRP